MIIAVIVLVILILFFLTGNILFQMTFARNVKGIAKQIINKATQNETSIPSLGPLRKNGLSTWDCLEKENVEIVSQDGIILRGQYYQNSNPKRTVILVHGYRTDGISNFAPVIPTFVTHDCNILLIDLRACGMSDGLYTTFGIMERFDILEWTMWLHRKEQGSLPVYIDGISMGGAAVAFCADFDFPPEVKALICDSEFTSPSEIIKTVMKNFVHLPSFPFLYLIDFFFRIKTGHHLSEVDARECMANSKHPVYFIHGKKDIFVPYYMGLENFNACTTDKKFFSSENSSHGMSFIDMPNECTAFVFDLFYTYDGDVK